jgi:NTE family protein
VSVRALVLSGGGAKGAYEAGVITSLWQIQPFDIVVGTSIGAINASLTAQHDIAALKTMWSTIAGRNVIQPQPTVKHVEEFLQAFSDWQSLPTVAKVSHTPGLVLLWMKIGSKTALFSLLGAFNEAPIEALLKQFANYNNLRSTLIVSATDITKRTATAFYAFVGRTASNVVTFRTAAKLETQALSQLNYVEVLEASAAIPAVFTPIQMNLGAPPPKFFVDGGVANNTPISLAVAAGADDITVVFLDPLSNDAPSPPPRNLIDIAFACYDVMQQKILEDDFNLASLTNVALDNHAAAPRAVQERLAGKRQVALRYVRPGKALPVSVLDFSDQSKLNAAFAQGLADGQHPQAFE